LKIKKRKRLIKLLGLVGTFLGSVVVCFVLLLGFIISRGKLDERGIKIGDIMPYVIVLSFVLATVFLIIILVEDKNKKRKRPNKDKKA
jgi:O-antigen/teichoic acid export membrane protein